MEIMRFGIYGCRHAHIHAFVEEMLSAGHRFVGVCETGGPWAEALSREYGAPLFDNEEQLFEQSPQIIGTAAVNCDRIGIIERCFERGIHVMTVKPAVIDDTGLDRLRDVISTGRIQVGMMLTERFSPAVYTLKRLIDDGALGQVIGLTLIKPHKLAADLREPWHFDMASNGGLIADLMIHDFDLARWLCGSAPESMTGYVRRGFLACRPGVFDSARILIRTKKAQLVEMESDWRMPEGYFTYGDARIICTGTLGRAEAFPTGIGVADREPCLLLTTHEADVCRMPLSSQPCTLAEDFVRRINGVAGGIVTHDDILGASADAVLARRSVEVVDYDD